MAEAFLRQILQATNRVQPDDEEQQCVICMEECGKMNEETGLLELAIRLPFCNHIVGSGCIAQWLHSNNTCPMCRHVFFSTQSSPCLEQGIVEGQIGHVQPNQAGMSRIQILTGPVSGVLDFCGKITRLCDDYCAQLYLEPRITRVATHVVYGLLDSGPSNAILQDDSDDHVVAVSICIASLLMGHPRTFREISGVIDNVDARYVRSTYNLLGDLSSIVDALESNESLDLSTPSWPPRGYEMAARGSALEDLIDLCSDCCVELDFPVDDTPVREVAFDIASRVWAIPSLHQTHRSPRILAAACVYMAGQLVTYRILINAISRVWRVSADDIAEVYGLLYAQRAHIVGEYWNRHLRRGDMEPPTRLALLAMLPTGAAVV